MILWFTYVKGAFRALTGKFGAGITFKTTIKGAGKLLDSVLGDLWMPLLCFILSAVSLGVGIHKLVSTAMAALFGSGSLSVMVRTAMAARFGSQLQLLCCAFDLLAVFIGSDGQHWLLHWLPVCKVSMFARVALSLCQLWNVNPSDTPSSVAKPCCEARHTGFHNAFVLS